MDVKIAGGKFRGKKLQIPDSFQDFRPTKSMVREAVCSSIQQDIAGSKILELCAGSGVFSLELLSRGAEFATAVELSADRASYIVKTAQQIGLSDDIRVVQSSVEAYLESLSQDESYDIIFFDPPYYTDELTQYIPRTLERLTDYGVLIFEFASDDTYVKTLSSPEGFEYREKKYGKSSIRYYRRNEE